MKKRIFWSIFIVSFITLILTSTLFISILYFDFTNQRKNDLAEDCIFISKALSLNNIECLKAIGKDCSNRITLISNEGTVLYDSIADAKSLNSHLDRPEIQAALKSGSGQATRHSKTIGKNTHYYAVKLNNDNILRVSVILNNFIGVVSNTAYITGIILIFILLTAIITARMLTKAIILPINKLNLNNPLSNKTYDELAPLLHRMNKQNKKIAQQIEEIETKQNELNTIAEKMNEALIVFDKIGQVIFANNSAKELFEIENIKGKNYLELCRDLNYINVVKSAFKGKSSNSILNLNGRIYQLTATCVAGSKNSAAVLFCVDITEKEQSDFKRREFAANVSHELKTPLSSIIGYAEIISNNIAKQPDIPRFANRIYNESKRLLALVENIIKLSKFDESKYKNEFTQVDLYEVAIRVISQLQFKATQNEVKLKLTGENAAILGIEQVLHELIFNLCDNGIVYNKKGGSVTIDVTKDNGKTILSVKDTGIGIPPEYKSRIFERFYRIDNSQIKDISGTGLGLSIVKHGAKLHNSEIVVESIEGVGTKFLVIFN